MTPCHIIDTRGPIGPNGGPALSANTIRNFPVINVNSCGVPFTARAVAFNTTAGFGGRAGMRRTTILNDTASTPRLRLGL